MRILITGGSGLLGQYVNIALAAEHAILTLYNTNPGNCTLFNSARVNLTDYLQLERIIDEFQPDCIVHLAALASPMLQEGVSHKQVYDINVHAADFLAKICTGQNIRLIYTSTDLVYAGYRGKMLSEDSKLVPISLYAETKLMGEVKIQKQLENHVILRTSLMYGLGLSHCSAHFDYMLSNLTSGKEVKLFTDQIRTPLSYSNAASIIKQVISNNGIKGIYNFGGKDRLSRYQMGEILCTLGNFNSSLLIPGSCKDIPNYPAVEDVSLNTEKLRAHGIMINSYEDEVRDMLRIYNAKKV